MTEAEAEAGSGSKHDIATAATLDALLLRAAEELMACAA